MTLSIPEESKRQAVDSIKRYFEEKRDEEIGDLHAGLLLDFFLREIAPTFYNRAIRDAQGFFQERAADLEGSCYEPEFGYWK
ncbi:MAG: DUF2164 domain-containing protein [Candidatus Eisenbacteria bacterium]